jgi:hypothetical protein
MVPPFGSNVFQAPKPPGAESLIVVAASNRKSRRDFFSDVTEAHLPQVADCIAIGSRGFTDGCHRLRGRKGVPLRMKAALGPLSGGKRRTAAGTRRRASRRARRFIISSIIGGSSIRLVFAIQICSGIVDDPAKRPARYDPMEGLPP